ncbi:NAD(P)H-quinone oxidoreductase [Sphingobacterium sp. LRF_L2]|uniref:NAD(P)H-quinone oxidoreductase n=1 Tax=Sphingobacterium sp. LRF_L2 TaxID=3369421 RepID=UPI003F6216EE
MKAVVISQHGGPEVLTIVDRIKPGIEDDEVLVEVKAAGINMPDILQRKGHYAAPKGVVADVPGLEVSGIIREIGARVTKWHVGDKVCCLVSGGGYAEFVAAHQDICLPIPKHLDFAEAAILPETIFTVWDNVFRRASLKDNEHILIHGGAGGIGSTAIQLAKAFGARVSVTVSTADKYDYCKDLGADIIINYRTTDFEEFLKTEHIDVILDCVGGAYFDKNINLLSADGRLVYINAMGGRNVQLDLLKVMQKRLLITGSTLRSRNIAFKSQLTQEVLDFVWPLMGTKFIPQLHKQFTVQEVVQAHQLIESGTHLGKVALVF